jgi:hypothetical protein
MKTANICVSIFLVIFGSAYAYLITQLPSRNLPNTLGSAFMPWVLVSCLFALSVLLFLRSVCKENREKFNPKIYLREGMGIILLTVIVFTYVNLMKIFGFIYITPFFIAVLMLMTGSRKWKEVISVSVISPICIYIFFQKIFQVILPSGSFFY